MSLGKLSAGLAHELNNPAAAIQRWAECLVRGIDGLSDVFLRAVAPSTAAALREPMMEVMDNGSMATPTLDALDRSDAEDALATWLRDRGVPEPAVAAETFVAGGLSTAELERLTHDVPVDVLATSLEWMAADLSLRRVAGDIADASGRSVELITAVKGYSNMDRAPHHADIDVHEGIRSTLTMLGPKLRDRGVVLRTDFGADAPHLSGNPGKLNQVWTNLLDNAIDAVAWGGTITIRTSETAGRAQVEIVDDGPGIPAEIRGRIFDPFFTTKEVGRGTGLGLDMARRLVEGHLGEVQVTSEPGRTCFSVRLPPAQPTDGDAATP